MYCQKCGAKMPETAKFCQECGCKLFGTYSSREEKHQKVYTVKTALKNYFQGAISETKLREAIRQGKISHVRVGNKILIREEALDDWMIKKEIEQKVSC